MALGIVFPYLVVSCYLSLLWHRRQWRSALTMASLAGAEVCQSSPVFDFRVWSEFCQHPRLPEEQDPTYQSSSSSSSSSSTSSTSKSSEIKNACIVSVSCSTPWCKLDFHLTDLSGSWEELPTGLGEVNDGWSSHIRPKHNHNCGDGLPRSWC